MSGNRRRNALVLVGHGSHISADSSAPVFAHADRIRRLGIFDEVLEAFWKEEPCLRDALDLIESENVWIVPVFLAEGYFTRQVVPRELGLDGPTTTRGERRIHYCAPVGTHPSMADMILERARAADGLREEQRRDAALVVIGHGTERSETSGDTVYDLVERLRHVDEFGTVECGFLDEAPAVEDVLARIPSDNVVLVPFFVAEGWHTRTTIPDDLGLTGHFTVQGTRRIWYSPPVGTLDRLSDVVLELAGEAGAPTSPPVGAALPARTDSLLGAARDAWLDWVAHAGDGQRDFLQLRIGRSRAGFEIRNRRDVGRPIEELQRLPDPAAARDRARFDDSGRYRPLRSAADLPSGWAMVDLPPEGLWSAVQAVYPAAALLWFRSQLGDLEPVSYLDWAARQTGIYSSLRNLDAEAVDRTVTTCCIGRICLRARLWSHSRTHALEESASETRVPCLEPCTLFATAARETPRSADRQPASARSA